jgi:hypothetical protein
LSSGTWRFASSGNVYCDDSRDCSSESKSFKLKGGCVRSWLRPQLAFTQHVRRETYRRMLPRGHSDH